jgi:hypothetical protein
VGFANTLAHEFGHKISQAYQYYSLPRPKPPDTKTELETCLRGAKSVKAAETPTGKQTPRDQYGEAFADWFAAEILANGPAAKSGSAIKTGLAHYCHGGYSEENPDAQNDEHPTHPARLNRIYAAQPVLRNSLGAPALNDKSDLEYCKPPQGWDLKNSSMKKEEEVPP